MDLSGTDLSSAGAGLRHDRLSRGFQLCAERSGRTAEPFGGSRLRATGGQWHRRCQSRLCERHRCGFPHQPGAAMEPRLYRRSHRLWRLLPGGGAPALAGAGYAAAGKRFSSGDHDREQRPVLDPRRRHVASASAGRCRDQRQWREFHARPDAGLRSHLCGFHRRRSGGRSDLDRHRESGRSLQLRAGAIPESRASVQRRNGTGVRSGQHRRDRPAQAGPDRSALDQGSDRCTAGGAASRAADLQPGTAVHLLAAVVLRPLGGDGRRHRQQRGAGAEPRTLPHPEDRRGRRQRQAHHPGERDPGRHRQRAGLSKPVGERHDHRLRSRSRRRGRACAVHRADRDHQRRVPGVGCGVEHQSQLGRLSGVGEREQRRLQDDRHDRERRALRHDGERSAGSGRPTRPAR